MPAGQGKSIIAAATAYLLLQQPSIVKVHLVYINKYLLAVDERQNADLFQFQTSGAVECHVGLDFEPKAKHEVVILDEADEFVYEQPQALSKFLARCRVL